jgi:hypothetical protein
MPTSNTFKYQTIWTNEYQKSNWAMPVYPVIADMQFKKDLAIGDTVKRRYRSNPIFAKTLGSDGSYSPQQYVEAEESFTINKQREASVRIVKPSVLHTDLDVTKSYGVQLANAIWQEIEGDTLYTAYTGAGSSLDAGDFGGTDGEGLSVSISNISDIPVLAMETFIGKNVVYNNNLRFGKLAYEDYGGMKTWIIPPQVWTQIQKYMIARVTPRGDEAAVNGYRGEFGDFQIFVANTLPFTARLALGANPTDGDTMTIKGVQFRFKDTLAANGDIKIGATAADTADNIVTALNALTTNVSSVYDALVDGVDYLTENGFVINKSDALHGLVATDGTTYVDIVIKGAGKVTTSQSFTSALNGFSVSGVSANRQCIQSLFVIAKNVCLAIRQEPEFWHDKVDGKVAENHVLWTVYDNNVFRDQARAIIALAVKCDGMNTYSNVHA